MIFSRYIIKIRTPLGYKLHLATGRAPFKKKRNHNFFERFKGVFTAKIIFLDNL